MLCNKSHFCRWFRVERDDLFPAFSPGVFVSLNTGFDFWCDSASGRPRRSNDEFVLEIIHFPLSECRNIMSRLVCWVFQINGFFLNQFSVQFLSRNGDGPDWSLIKVLGIVKFYLCSLLSIPAGEKLYNFHGCVWPHYPTKHELIVLGHSKVRIHL